MFIRTERSIQEFVRLYPIISIITIINVLLYVIIYWLPFSLGNFLYFFGIGQNHAVSLGEYWRIITPIFMHGGFVHLLFNSFALIIFGPALEIMLGRVKFIIAYLLMGIAGNVGTYIIDPSSTTFHLGASGAIYGLFGVYMYMVYFRKDLIHAGDAQIVQTIFVIGLIMTFIQQNINIAAHLFGFIGGLLIAPIILVKAKPFFKPIIFTKVADGNNSDIRFNPNRWSKNRRKPGRKNIILIIFALLVVIGFISRYL